MSQATAAERTAGLFHTQAEACRLLRSPLYGDLLEHAADDLLAGGPTADVVAGHLEDRGPSALALRMLGGAHALALTGAAPDLAAFYPSAGGHRDPGPRSEHAWTALRRVFADDCDLVRHWLDSPPQTNEVGRGAALIGGLGHVVAEAQLPVRLFEIGASAGLNLRADRFHVAGDVASYGDPRSRVVLPHAWLGRPPPTVAIDVVARSGGDLAPVDPASDQGRLTLMAYVWPDQTARFERLTGALAVAAEVPAEVRAEPASATVARTLTADGTWTVLWHSVMRSYLDRAQKDELDEGIRAVAATATATRRFAHLSLEPRRRRPDASHEFLVTLTTWPTGDERILAVADPHGIPVRWER